MNRSAFNKMIVPGLFAAPIARYKQKSKEALWRQLCSVRSSKKAFEDSAYLGGLGLPHIKPEGTGVAYDDLVQGPTKRWIHVTYGLATTITEEAIEDIQYDDVPTSMTGQTREIGDSIAELTEVLVHNVFNNGTATTYHTCGDTLALFSGSHTRLRGGTFSNLLSPAADLSATTLQTAIDNFMTIKSMAGRYQSIKPRRILLHPNNAWKAKELLRSGYDPETANNAINAIKDFNLSLVISPHYTDTDAFTLIAEPATEASGLIAFERRKPKFATDGDFETGDVKFKGTYRFSVECNLPDNLYHSAGA